MLFQKLQRFGDRRAMDLQILRRLGKAPRVDNFNKNPNRFKEVYLHKGCFCREQDKEIVINFITVMNIFGCFS